MTQNPITRAVTRGFGTHTATASSKEWWKEEGSRKEEAAPSSNGLPASLTSVTMNFRGGNMPKTPSKLRGQSRNAVPLDMPTLQHQPDTAVEVHTRVPFAGVASRKSDHAPFNV